MEHVEQTIADAQKKLAEMEKAVIDMKTLINGLCAMAGKPPLYADSALVPSNTPMAIRRDQFYGRGIYEALKEILEIRKSESKGPATVNELHAALRSGGYNFEAKDEENEKRGVRISLAKNSGVFHRLPEGNTWGLLKWYPGIKPPKSADNDQAAAEKDDEIDKNESEGGQVKEGDKK